MKTKRFTLPIPKALRDALRSEAERTGRSMAEIIRWSIESYLPKTIREVQKNDETRTLKENRRGDTDADDIPF